MASLEYIARRVETQFVEQANDVAACLRKRIVPSFDSIEAEADAEQERVYEEAAQNFDPDTFDPADDYESSFEAGLDLYMRAAQMKQAYVNMTVVMLWHLFEQQLRVLVRRELPPVGYDDEPVDDPVGIATRLFKSHGVNLFKLPSMKKLDEVRLVANTVKHTDGDAATALRSKRPELFTDPRLEVGNREPPITVDFTAFGDDLYVTLDIIDEYVGHIVSFWNEMAAKLREAAQRRP